MTRYETTSQWASLRTRRRLGLAGTVVTIGLGSYLLTVFLTEGDLQYTTAGSVPLLLAIFLFTGTLLPLSFALGNRPHPTSIEVTDEALTLTFAGGRVSRLSWEEGTIDLALDTRTAVPRKRGRPGLEVTLWLPVTGETPGSTALRPQQVIVSAHAFDEIRRRVRGAGYVEVQETPRRGGTLLKYAKPDPETGA